MKIRRQTLIATALLLVATASFAAGDHKAGHEHKPLHGGVVVEASDMDFELVVKADTVTLYVRDHGKVANTAGASAKLTLLTGTQKSQVALTPAGSNMLQAKGSFAVGKGTKAVVAVTLLGKKPVNVRFVL